MTDKELLNLEHYKKLIENRKFDEYDIIGFLVLIREHIDCRLNPLFYDFANGTAHRTRCKGIIYDNIYNAILNNYQTDSNNKILGFNSVLNSNWDIECANISKQFKIKMTPIIRIELLVCMISIIHRSLYNTTNKSTKKV